MNDAKDIIPNEQLIISFLFKKKVYTEILTFECLGLLPYINRFQRSFYLFGDKADLKMR